MENEESQGSEGSPDLDYLLTLHWTPKSFDLTVVSAGIPFFANKHIQCEYGFQDVTILKYFED